MPRRLREKLLGREGAAALFPACTLLRGAFLPDVRTGVGPRRKWAKMAASGTCRVPSRLARFFSARAAPGLGLPLLLLLGACGVPAQAGRSQVKALSDDTWKELLRGEWMVEFYAPWCPACQNLQPEWETFAEWGEDLEINVAKVDVTEQPGLSGRFVITALPTIYQMSSMSALFQLSMWIRHCHNYFTEDLGVPAWGSYAIFALMTLFSGLLLGLVMVFLADCVCPSKRHKTPQYPYQKLPVSAQLLKDRSEELDEDELPGPAGEPLRPAPGPSAVRQRAGAPTAAAEQS
ncbi:hypothetical protein lerEdw1_007544 [Lerista edwardsae]|nr:hypothetical protein lerEdw1_007544 [Lerista edwardsae]